MCPLHSRKLEIICIDDQQRICSNCALFGIHKNHDVRMESDVAHEIQVRSECLMDMYEIMDHNQIGKIDQAQVEQMYLKFRGRSTELRTSVQQRFKQLKEALKVQEKSIETDLNRNINFIEHQFQILRNVPTRLIDDADRWLKTAKVKLDNFV
jgi:hypothetical protein